MNIDKRFDMVLKTHDLYAQYTKRKAGHSKAKIKVMTFLEGSQHLIRGIGHLVKKNKYGNLHKYDFALAKANFLISLTGNKESFVKLAKTIAQDAGYEDQSTYFYQNALLIWNVWQKEGMHSALSSLNEFGIDIEKFFRCLDENRSVEKELASFPPLPIQVRRCLVKESLNFEKDKESIQSILKQPRGSFQPHDLIAKLSEDPLLAEYYSKSVGVREGYSLEEHSKMVVGTYEKFIPTHDFEENGKVIFTRDDMRLFLVLHDIGKPAADETIGFAGVYDRKEKELLYNTLISERVASSLGISKEKIAIFKAMFKYDTLGLYLKGKIDDKEATTQIKHMAEEANISPRMFLKIMEVYFRADAGSYPKLQSSIFVADEKNAFIGHAYHNRMKMQRLQKALEIPGPDLFALPSTVQPQDQMMIKQVLDWVAYGLDKVPTEKLAEFDKDLAPMNDESIQSLKQSIQQELKLRSHNLDKFNALLAEDLAEVDTIVKLFDGLNAYNKNFFQKVLIDKLLHHYQTSLFLEQVSKADKDLSMTELYNRMERDPTLEKVPPFLEAILLHEDLKHQIEKAKSSEQIDKMINTTNMLLNKYHRLQINFDPTMQTTAALAYDKATTYYIKHGHNDLANQLMETSAENIVIDPSNPLFNIESTLSQKSEPPNKDICYLTLDSNFVRNRSVRVSEKKINHEEFYEIDVELPSKIRRKLKSKLDCVVTQPGVTANKVPAKYLRKDFSTGEYVDDKSVVAGKELQIEFEGIGAISVGTSKEYHNQYNMIRLRVKKGSDPQNVQKLFARIGLPMAMQPSREEDARNEALAQIIQYRYPNRVFNHHPKKSLNKIYDGLTLKEKEQVNKDLENIQLRKVGNGLVEQVLPSCVEDVRNNGTAAFGTFLNAGDITSTSHIMGKIVKGGQISTIERFHRGIIGLGCCPIYNFKSGSANQVFTRALPENLFMNGYDIHNFAISGSIFLLYDVQAAERMPYSYLRDRGGLRNPDLDMVDFKPEGEELEKIFIGKEKINERLPDKEYHQALSKNANLRTQETMFNGTLGQQYLKGAIVGSENDKAILMDTLMRQGIYDINGVPLEEAIFISKTLKPEMLKKEGE